MLVHARISASSSRCRPPSQEEHAVIKERAEWAFSCGKSRNIRLPPASISAKATVGRIPACWEEGSIERRTPAVIQGSPFLFRLVVPAWSEFPLIPALDFPCSRNRS